MIASSCLLSAVYAASSEPVEMPCSHVNDEFRTSFDLSPLQKSAIPYTAQDRLQTSEKNYLYTFGVCKSVAPPQNCQTKAGESRVRWSTSPAWQTRTDESAHTVSSVESLDCKYLGSPEQDTHEWSVNPEDPAAGVTLTYTNGQSCSSGQRRKLALNFKCAPKTISKIEDLIIDESAHCEYDITIDSEYACPLECGLADTGSVCSAHGLCGYDSDAKRSRCYCNQGRIGEHCTEAAQAEGEGAAYGPLLGLLIFVALAMVVVIGLLVALVRFMRGRNVEIMGDVYQSLNTGPDTFEVVPLSDIEREESGHRAIPVMPPSSSNTKFSDMIGPRSQL